MSYKQRLISFLKRERDSEEVMLVDKNREHVQTKKEAEFEAWSIAQNIMDPRESLSVMSSRV